MAVRKLARDTSTVMGVPSACWIIRDSSLTLGTRTVPESMLLVLLPLSTRMESTVSPLTTRETS